MTGRISSLRNDQIFRTCVNNPPPCLVLVVVLVLFSSSSSILLGSFEEEDEDENEEEGMFNDKMESPGSPGALIAFPLPSFAGPNMNVGGNGVCLPEMGEPPDRLSADDSYE